MSMSISSVGSGSSGGFDPSMMASKMMNDLDPNNTGNVTKDQFVSGLTAKGMTTADATKMYDSIDTKKAGSITKSDIETAIKTGNLKPPFRRPARWSSWRGWPRWIREIRGARRCGWSWGREQFFPNLCRSRHEQGWRGFRSGSSNLRHISPISGSH